jgi:predicted SAM-dependent methyltransferase
MSLLIDRPPVRYHLGCGERRLEGWVNVDLQETAATDLVTDLARPELEAAEACFSSAFFEHLRRTDRVPHLEAVRRALTPDGFVCYLALPDFHAVARLYLDQGPGIVGPVFDLFNAYRYTHGDPELAGGDPAAYVAQLHKSLFDADEVDRLLTEAGFPAYTVFSSVFPGEPVAVSLGFYAANRPRPTGELRTEASQFLAGFDGRFIDADSLMFVGGASRSVLGARLTGSRPRRAVRRVARAAAAYLARV